MEITFKRYKYKIILFVTSSILLLSHLGKLDVNIMEARNFTSAREMVQNREYLLTTLNNEPRYQKPPLPTWITAVSGKIFGFNSIYFLRLPVVAITLLLVFFYFHLCRGMGMTEKVSLIYALILITSFYIFFAGRDNQWDIYTHSFMLGSILFLWKLLNNDTHQVRNSLFSGFFLGLSILSKGPISVYTLLVPFLISYGIVYRIPLSKKWPYYLGMVSTGLIIGLSWYVYVRFRDQESFNSIIEKETSNWTSYEVKPFYYYWSFFLQSGLWATASLTALFFPWLIKRVKDKRAYIFALIWTISGLVLMSLIPEKKIRYLLPVLIPLAMTTGFYIEYLMNSDRSSLSRPEKILTWFVFGIFAISGLIYPVVLPVILKGDLIQYLFLYIFSSAVMLIVVIFIIRGIRMVRFKTVFIAMIIMFVNAVIALIPISKIFTDNPEYVAASSAAAIAKEAGIKTYRLSDISPELVWSFGKPIPSLITGKDEIAYPYEDKFGLLVAEADTTLINTKFGDYNLERKIKIEMYPGKKHKKRLVKDFYLVTRDE